MLIVKVVKVNGHLQLLPAGGDAELLARRLGSDSLSAQDLSDAARELDTEIVMIEGKCEEAAALFRQLGMGPVSLH